MLRKLMQPSRTTGKSQSNQRRKQNRALKLLCRLNLRKVAAEAKKGKKLTLKVFFVVRTHVPGIAFRTACIRARYLASGGFELSTKTF